MKVVSFFAGCGGLDLGFEQAGFNVVWANEYDSAVRKTYMRNHPNTEFVLGDINKITPDRIPDCDGFIGGPPCQSWSVAGKQRGLDDARGKLFLTYIELIKAKRPKFFLIENVKGMLDAKFSDVFQDFINRLDSAGYDVKWKLLDAVDFKIPQNRERVFLIGFRKDLSVRYDFPSATCTQPVTLSQAIGDIIEEPIRYAGKTKIVPNKQRSNHDVLTSEFGPFYYRGNRRRGWQQPSFTIHATADNIQLHPSSPKMLFYGHERWNFQKDKIEEYRRLSVRECARIQTFPDSFVFECDNIKASYKMIGNAVPPRLGKVLAQSILSCFSQKSATPRCSNQHSCPTDACVLVGYYKSSSHYDLIIKNLLYYVRSDGRVGSVFRETCDVTPKYLLLHHKDEASLFELDSEEPVLTDSSFLKKCGFSCHGDSYLCFRLKCGDKLNTQELTGSQCVFVYDKYNYAPLFTTLDKIIKRNECR
jgi:DNA (cytosine-5)-methyltransferase 1